MIQVESLQKSYGTFKAVNGISFDIPRGEAFGLLGPNGAGKTTTLHLIVGLLRPGGGAIHIDGDHDPMRPEVRGRIGIVPQALSIYEELTAEENLLFFGRLYHMNGARLAERVKWALEFVGLFDRRKDRAKTYSGGMKRRLNIACAILHEPPVILFDEPTVGVDPQSRNLIFDNIETLKRNGITILYTTHYMEEAQRLCDRVGIMDQGKILALDTVEGLIHAHGGHSVVEVEFESPPPEPEKLPGVVKDARLRVETERPLEVVADLAGAGLKFLHLKVDRPGLEEVFLNLTGRSLRD